MMCNPGAVDLKRENTSHHFDKLNIVGKGIDIVV